METFRIGNGSSDPVKVAIEDGYCNVGIVGSCHVDITVQRVLKTKKPYVVNLSNVECLIGEWNKDKREYGVRIYFVSGKDVWIGGIVARDLLGRCGVDKSEELVGKFDDHVEAGMPTV